MDEYRTIKQKDSTKRLQARLSVLDGLGVSIIVIGCRAIARRWSSYGKIYYHSYDKTCHIPLRKTKTETMSMLKGFTIPDTTK